MFHKILCCASSLFSRFYWGFDFRLKEDCQHLVIENHWCLQKGHLLSHIGLPAGAPQNKVGTSRVLLSYSQCYIFCKWQKQKKWIYGKNTSSGYWDVSKVKRRKTVSQQLAFLFPQDIWNVPPLPSFLWYGLRVEGEAPQVTRAGSLDWRASLSERDRCVIEDIQPWPTGRQDRLGGSDKQPPNLCMRTHTATCFYALIIILLRGSFILSLGTWEDFSSLFYFNLRFLGELHLILKWNSFPRVD